jgi:hypothetical protein
MKKQKLKSQDFFKLIPQFSWIQGQFECCFLVSSMTWNKPSTPADAIKMGTFLLCSAPPRTESNVTVSKLDGSNPSFYKIQGLACAMVNVNSLPRYTTRNSCNYNALS